VKRVDRDIVNKPMVHIIANLSTNHGFTPAMSPTSRRVYLFHPVISLARRVATASGYGSGGSVPLIPPLSFKWVEEVIHYGRY